VLLKKTIGGTFFSSFCRKIKKVCYTPIFLSSSKRMEAVSWSQEVNNPTISNFVDPAPQQEANFGSNFDIQSDMRNCTIMSCDGKISRSSPSFQITNGGIEDQYDNFSANLDDLFETIAPKNAYQVYGGLISENSKLWKPKEIEQRKKAKMYLEGTMKNNVKQEIILPNIDQATNKSIAYQNNLFNDQSPGSVVNCPESMNESIELYHDLIMRHLVQDIISTSSRLKISCGKFGALMVLV
uniref:Uncharacterized protein n=1 Tax=Romanomermis culicivorax TaxID=13658 RepID=A0A915I2L8_ROMCU